MKKALITLLALTILGLSIWVTKVQNNAIQHTKQSEQSTEPTHEEREEVVEGGEGVEGTENGGQLLGGERSGSDTEIVGNEEITTYIKEIFGESSDWGLGVAFCESSFNPNALSSTGKYIGLYQFGHTTFDSNCEGSIYEWKDQVNCTHELFERGEVNRWPNCP